MKNIFTSIVGSFKILLTPSSQRRQEKSELYQAEGIAEFLKSHLEDFRAFLAEIERYEYEPEVQRPVVQEPSSNISQNVFEYKPQRNKKTYSEEYSELQERVKKYRKEFDALPDGDARDRAIQEMNKAAQELKNLKQRAIDENFSLLEKKDLSGMSEDEIWEYFSKYAFPIMKNNEASALDGIELFEKYGFRKVINQKNGLKETTLGNFITAIPKKPSDSLISRLFDAADKFAVANNRGDYYDISVLRFLLTDGGYDLRQNISEDSLLKGIGLAKKMHCWETFYKTFPEDIEIRYLDRKFAHSPRFKELKAEIDELKDLAKI